MIGGQNKMIPVVISVLTVALVVLALSKCSGSNETAPMPTAPGQQANTLSAEADTPAEVLKSVSQQLTSNAAGISSVQSVVQNLETRLQDQDRTIAEMKAQAQQQQQQPQEANPIGTNVSGMSPEQVREMQVLTAENDRLRSQGQAPQAQAQDSGLSGLGIEAGTLDSPQILNQFIDGQSAVAAVQAQRSSSAGSLAAYVRIQPLDAETVNVDLGQIGQGQIGQAQASLAQSNLEPDPLAIAPALNTEPVATYTIPANSTLLEAITMTALIGRIPTSGTTLSDPYPFKVLTGAENLASNGIYIPGLTGMVWSGIAYGDWGLSCVRGTLYSVTFTFADGTIRTLDTAKLQKLNPDSAAQTQQSGQLSGLAYITDERGICVKGERLSNAAPVLAQRMGASALESAAQALAQSQTTTILNQSTGTAQSLLTGDAAKFGAYSGLAGGASDLKSYLDQRLGQVFDAIYAPPATQLALHINFELPIDYDPRGRKVTHNNGESGNASNLH